MTWHPKYSTSLGAGIQISSTQISPLGISLNTTPAKLQNQKTSFELLDYADSVETLKKLHFNAWAEWKFVKVKGSTSFDYKSYRAVDSATRKWEIDASSECTFGLPKPSLNSTALKYITDAAKFHDLFGNYAVTSAKYVRRIRIRFEVSFRRSYSETEFNATITASFKHFAAGGGASAFFSELSKYYKTVITVVVEGQPGGAVVAVASEGDLEELRKIVADQLEKWKSPPATPDDAGNITDVTLTSYNNIPPGVAAKQSQSPSEIGLLSAIATYLKLISAVDRLEAIQRDDSYLYARDPITNKDLYVKTRTYLFGSRDSQGNHDGKGKLAEAWSKAILQYNYITDLTNGKTAKDPQIVFFFDDPDVVKWRVLVSLYNPGALNSLVVVEIYGLPPVEVQAAVDSDASHWGTNWHATLSRKSGFFYVSDRISAEESLLRNLDPVTGIPHRYAELTYDHPSQHTDFELQLVTNTGGWFSNAINWQGWPAPTLFIPGSQFVIRP